ncbi:MAG: hypothetical protein AAGJ93_05025, partial [Bacteroidota bacterium]
MQRLEKITFFLALLGLAFASTGCQGKKITQLETDVKNKQAQIEQLEEEITHLRQTNGSLLGSMADLS